MELFVHIKIYLVDNIENINSFEPSILDSKPREILPSVEDL